MVVLHESSERIIVALMVKVEHLIHVIFRKVSRMKAKLHGKIVEVWQVSLHDKTPPLWVKEAFAKGYLRWVDKRLLIVMPALRPSTVANLKLGMVGTLGGGFCGYAMYVMADSGDFLDVTDHRVVSARKFFKKYQLIN